MPPIILCVVLMLLLNPAQTGAQQLFAPVADTVQWQGLRVLPQNFYNKHLGFFCRQEELLQKKTGLPLYFRLGSKAYVDYLEKKPNAVKGF